MAGLLDFFGNGWEDPKSNAVMALAGGLLDGDFAGGMKGYSQVMAGAGDAKMKRLMQEAQIAKYGADTEMDKQKLSLSQAKEKRDAEFETMLNAALKSRQLGGVATPNMPVTGSQDGGSQVGGQGAMSGGGQSYNDPFAGVNPMAMMLDMRNNGGKKMGDWVNDRTAPKWENINGNMVNTNAPNFQGGFQAGMKASDNGQMSMWQPDGQGGLIVGAPRGALDTYSAYRNADEAAKSKFGTTTITTPGGGTSLVTNDTLLNMARGNQPAPMQRPAAAGSEAQIIANAMGGLNGLPMTARGGTVSMKSTPSEMDKPRIFQDAFQAASQQFANAQKLGDIPAMNRAQSDMREIQKELGGNRPQSLAPNQAPQSAPSFGLPLQSQQEKDRMAAENDAYKAKLVDTAKADVARESTKTAEKKQYNQFSTGIDRAIDLLKQNPTASGIGAMADTGLGFIGQSTKSGDTANQLNALSGWLTANVPRMEGPQSNFDVENYKLMAGAVGDRTKPISTRLAAAEEVKKLQEKYADINRGGEPKKQESKNIIDSLPAANTSNRGQRIRDTTTGKILKSNGISWVAE